MLFKKFPKGSKIPKSQKSFFLNLKKKKISKKNSLFLILGNMRFDSSSQVQPNPEKKIRKNLFSQKYAGNKKERNY